MSVLWMDSFDHYVSADFLEKYSSFSSAPSIAASSGRRSSGAFQGSGGTSISKVLAPITNTIIMGAAFQVPSLPGSSGKVFQVLSSGTVQMVVSLTNAGALRAYRGDESTILGTSAAGVITTGAYFYVEMKAVIHTSAGSVVVRVNEVEVLNLTSINTAQAAVNTWNTCTLNCGGSSWLYDDFYVCDSDGSAPMNNFLGDVRVDARRPTAAGATTGFTPSAGSNWQNVDDATPNDDTDYNSSASMVTDTFVVENAPIVGAAIYGVQSNISVKKTDAGTCTVSTVLRPVSTDLPATAVAVGTAYGYLVNTYSVDPATGVQWTESGFNACEFGYKRVS